MTVQNQNVKNVYRGNGSTTVFPFTFAINESHPEYIHVYITNDGGKAAETTDFTCDMETRTITYPKVSSSAPKLSATQRLTIYRLLPYEQNLNLVNQGPFFSEDVETQLDDLEMQIQQLNENLVRCFQIGIEAQDFDMTMELEPGKVICVNSDGNGFEAREALMEEDGNWDGEGRRIESVADPIAAQDVVTKKYVDTLTDNNFMKLQHDGTAWEARNLPISNVAGPALVKDAANKDYVDRILAGYSGQGDRFVFFDNVAQMQAAELVPSQMAVTLGYHDVNDGGAGVYTIRDKGADTPDGGSVIEIPGTDYVAELITDGSVTVKQYGAKGDANYQDGDGLWYVENTHTTPAKYYNSLDGKYYATSIYNTAFDSGQPVSLSNPKYIYSDVCDYQNGTGIWYADAGHTIPSADDTTAIKNAIAKFDTVYFTEGTYNIADSVYIHDRTVNLIGQGGVIQETQNIGNCVFYLKDCPNSIIRGLKINGTGKPIDNAVTSGYAYHGIRATSCNNIVIEGNTITNNGAGGIYIFETQYAKICKNYLAGNLALRGDIYVGYASSVNGLKDVIVSENYCLSENQMGIALQGHGNRITCVDNIVRNHYGYGIMVYRFENEDPWKQVIVSNNHVENIHYNPNSGYYDGMGIYIQTVEEVIVSNNVLKNIMLDRPDGESPNTTLAPGAIAFGGPNKLICTNNFINGSGIYGISCGSGPGIENTSALIANNTILNAYHTAIFASGRNMKISSNFVSTEGDGITKYGIRVLGNLQNNTHDIVITDNNVSHTLGYGIFVDKGSSTNNIKNIYILNNNIEDVYGTHCQIYNVINMQCIGNKITQNEVALPTGNHYGLLVNQCENLLVRDNLLIGDSTNKLKRGLNILNSTDGIVGNNIIKNASDTAYIFFNVGNTNVYGYFNILEGKGLPEVTPYQMADTFGRNGMQGRNVEFANAIPTSGTHAYGSIVYNTAPTAGGNVGWVCTTGGTPGTWKAFGGIQA